MAIFGYNTIGAVTSGNLTGDTNFGSRFTATENGTIIQITAYVQLNASGTASMRVAIFNNGPGDTIGTLLAQSSGSINVTNTSFEWRSVPINATITAGTTYWIFGWVDPSGIPTTYNYKADINAISNSIAISWANAYPSWATTGDGANEAYDLAYASIYADYIPSTSSILGYETAGSSSNLVALDNYYGCRFVASTSGTITSMGAYLSSTGIGNVTFGIYADSAGAPGSLLATSTTTGSFTTSPAWTSGNISLPITSGTAYWLSLFGDDNTTLFYDAGSTNQYFLSGSGNVYPNFDNPATVTNTQDWKVSIYAAFTPLTSIPSMSGIKSTLGISSITF